MTSFRFLVALVTATAGTSLFAADPVAPLRPLVPPDATVVFVVRNLGPQLKALGESPMAAWLATSPLVKQFVDPKEAEKLIAVRDFVTGQLGVTSDELRDDIFGEAVVFAFQPGDPGKPETDGGTMFVRPRDPAALERLVERVNKAQQAAGEVTAVRPAEHAGVRYFVREKANKGREFYALHERLFVLTNREATLHGVLTKVQSPDDKPVPKWLALDDGQSTLAALFNPRALDASWAERAAGGADAGDRAFHKQFAKVWAALDGLCLSARADATLTLRVTADIDDARLPPEWQRLLSPATGPSPSIVAPAGSLLAVHGRVNLRTLLDVASPFLPDGGKEFRKQLDDVVAPAVGRDDWPTVLDKLGPEVSFWVKPTATAATVEAALAVRLGPTPADAARLAPPLRQALDALAHLGRFEYNRKHADQVALRPAADGATLDNPRGFPTGFAPTYRVAAEAGYAVVATNPDVRVKPSTRSVENPPLLRLSLTECHAYLRDHRAEVAKFLAAYEARPAADIARELGNMLPVLEAGRSIEVRLSRDRTRVAATITIEFVKPLSK